MNLNQLTLPVNDMAKAKAFYLTLGAVLIVDTPHYVRFACKNEAGNLGSSFSLSLTSSAAQRKADPEAITLYFEHQALDVWVEELELKGVVFEQLPKDQSYLWREALLIDPSGNKIKLYWAGENRLNPPWRVPV
ncbi:VOC family protein [Shewanella sp.]|uniref:VOC family protein n=1 Tax=Shewanella sp. TaxID=50422 RepID=UPI004053D6FC